MGCFCPDLHGRIQEREEERLEALMERERELQSMRGRLQTKKRAATRNARAYGRYVGRLHGRNVQERSIRRRAHQAGEKSGFREAYGDVRSAVGELEMNAERRRREEGFESRRMEWRVRESKFDDDFRVLGEKEREQRRRIKMRKLRRQIRDPKAARRGGWLAAEHRLKREAEEERVKSLRVKRLKSNVSVTASMSLMYADARKRAVRRRREKPPVEEQESRYERPQDVVEWMEPMGSHEWSFRPGKDYV